MIQSSVVLLTKPKQPINAKIQLASSKSESNRALIINALAGNKGFLQNLSEARDTQTLQRLLQSNEHTLDVIDAGTTMRFLTAYLSVTNQDKILTGTQRMCERPIALLVEALRQLGATIDYLKNQGFPPIHIKGMLTQANHEITIRGDVSSQYISALLMIAPVLPQGLRLHLTGEVGSKPYIDMTLKQMQYFGITSVWEGKDITIAHQAYVPTNYSIESDWSGASYWYSMVALSEGAEIELLGLKSDSLQGDSRIATIMEPLGVQSVFTDKGVRLTHQQHQQQTQVDFTDCPDLAQTVAVVCAAKGIHLTMTGIESLKIKETDRVKALQQELSKFGSLLQEKENQVYEISPMPIANISPITEVETYDDHRMAMAFAPLALITPIKIHNPGVVVKSYPGFWNDLQQAGFAVE